MLINRCNFADHHIKYGGCERWDTVVLLDGTLVVKIKMKSYLIYILVIHCRPQIQIKAYLI